MDEITFANGATFSCSFCAENPIDRVLFVAISDVSFAEAAVVFSDPSLTQEISFAGSTYSGYTELLSLQVQPYGFQAALRKQQ